VDRSLFTVFFCAEGIVGFISEALLVLLILIAAPFFWMPPEMIGEDALPELIPPHHKRKRKAKHKRRNDKIFGW